MNTGEEGGSEDVVSERDGGPSVFSEAELAAAASGPGGEPELEDVEAAEIDEKGPEVEPFERLVARSRKLSDERVRTVLESLLFVAGRPLTLDQLFECTGIERPLIARALEAMAARHKESGSGITLYEVAGGFQLRSSAASAEYVRRFLRVKPQRLTRAAVETLAIIAYRQPVTRPEVEDIRGVDCGAVIKALLDRRLLKILGKKEEVGRPILYGTTDEFLEFFALKDLSALPTLREFQELTQEHQEIVEKETAPGAEGTVGELADGTFQERLNQTTEASEVALEELEAAMRVAEDRTRVASELLNPRPPNENV